MTVQISQGLLDALDAASKVGPGERMVGRLEARLPGPQDEALDALALAMTGDKSKRSVAAREVLAAGFRALAEDYGRESGLVPVPPGPLFSEAQLAAPAKARATRARTGQA